MYKAFCNLETGNSFLKANILYVLVLLLAAAPVYGDSSSVKERTLTKIANDTYVIRHKDAPDGFPQGNTTIIIGDQDVLIIDSCYLPSSAREDIAEVQRLTPKPIRYLLNTHWHADHTRGNPTYADTFPSISIIAQTATRDLIKGYYADHPENAVVVLQRHRQAYSRYLETGKNDDGSPLTDADSKELANNVAGTDVVVAEFNKLVPRVPNVVFDRDLDLDLGNRQVQIRFLGRGNTAGDTVAFLPSEKILIAGDLVVHPGPFTGSGFPSEWSQTLKRMIELHPSTVVPGHGEVLHGTLYLQHLAELAETVTEMVRSEYYRLTNAATLVDVQKAIDKKELTRRFGSYFKDDAQNGEPYLDLDSLIKVAYEEIQPR